MCPLSQGSEQCVPGHLTEEASLTVAWRVWGRWQGRLAQQWARVTCEGCGLPTEAHRCCPAGFREPQAALGRNVKA